jgi:hypothetical protein
LDDLLLGKVGRRFEAGGFRLLRRSDRLSWEPFERKLPEVLQLISGSGSYAVHQGDLDLRQKSEVVDVIASPNEAFLSVDAIKGALHWRLPQEGERWRPFGSEGSKPVLRFLADRGMPSYARRVKGLLADEAGVLWIPGFTIADRAQVHPSTTGVYHARFHPSATPDDRDQVFV